MKTIKSLLGCVILGGLLLAGASSAYSQPLTFNTLAGYAGQGSADGSGSNARFYTPSSVAVDGTGNVYVADTANHTIRQITPGGVVSTLAGSAGVSGSADGTGSAALFNQPQGVAVDSAGNVYVADTGNHTIRQITPAGVVSTLAGLPGVTGSANGTGSNALFYQPEGVAVDSAGNVYVADTWNHTIRKITAGGAVSTLAGSAGNYGSADGTGSAAQFYQPQGVAVDSSGNVYVADTGNQTIRKITAGAAVSTLAGLARNYGSADGTGTNAQFYGPAGVAVDGLGNVYVADYFNQTLRKVTGAGIVSTPAGAAGSYGSADGTNTTVRFWGPAGIAVSGTNNVTVYVADAGNGTIRKLTAGANWVSSTLAGSASTGSADATGSAARLYWPGGAAVDSAGNVYVADTQNGTVRKVTTDGAVTTLAGAAGHYGSADGTGTNAQFYGPQGIAMDNGGNVYVADTVNATIRKITAGGVVSTLAGTAGSYGTADGTGSAAQFYEPQSVAVDSGGNVYVADTWNHTIRKVTAAGVVTTLAGLPGNCGCIDGTGSNVGTNTARFNSPAGLAVDSAGNVYVADYFNHTIRKVTPAGVVRTLAGLAGVWGNADGTNSDARFFEPAGIAVDSATNVYVLDSGNHTIRKLAPVGTNWVVSTVAGLPGVSGSSDGMGSDARFNYPAGLAADGSGLLYVADTGNNTIRRGALISPGPPIITGQPQDQTASQGASATFAVIAYGSVPLYYQWRWYGANLAGAMGTSLALTGVTTNQNGPYTVVVTNAYGAATSQVATLTVTPTFQAGGLSLIWSLAPGSRPYLTTNSLPYERGMAYNPVSGRLLVVSRITPSVYVLDAATGADSNPLSVSGVTGGTYALLMIGVAEDGVVYAGNLTTASSTTPFTLYRWANDSSNTVPTVAFSGNPTPGNSQRYGDTLDVRGVGTNTQVIIGSRSSTNAVILTTTDGATFTAKSITVADASAGGFGLGIAFGPTNTFWGKANAMALRQVTYNLAAGTGSSSHVYTNPVFPNAVGPIGVSTPLNLLAGINVGAANNHLRLYDLSPALTNGAPALIATNAFATDNDNSGTGTGAVDFGANTVYALCANNGLIALQIVPPAQPGHFDWIGLLTNGSVQLTMSGTPAKNYVLEYTRDWAGWTNLTTLSGTNGLFQYTDPAATNTDQRFYRLKLGP
jgi:hypothetical protein